MARRVRDWASAEDLVHAVFERALEHLGELRDDEAVRKLGTDDRALAAWAEVETLAEALERIEVDASR